MRRKGRAGRKSTSEIASKRTRAQPTSNGLGIASLVCGILGLLMMPFILSTLAIIFGVIGRRQNQRYAQAGLVLGIIGLALMVVMLIFFTFWAGLSVELLKAFF